MLMWVGIGLFLAGLAASAWVLLRFERGLRRAWTPGGAQAIDRKRVGAALRGLIATSLVSGMGIGTVGMTAFVWGRAGAPGAWSYVWAGLFAIVAGLGWTTIAVMAFMARVNALERGGRR